VVISSSISGVARWKLTDVSGEHITSIFRVEEYSKQETSLKQVILQKTAIKEFNYELIVSACHTC
jgi:hypothetical protein